MNDLYVVFGTGSLGAAVAEAARDRGHRVRLVSRSGKARLDGIETMRADATKSTATREVCEGATVVFNCAAPPYTEWEEMFLPLQSGITEGAKAAGAFFVSAENVYPYGEVSGPMTEQTRMNPCSRKGEVKAELNRVLLKMDEDGTLRTALGRAPDYYGPRATATTIYGERVFYPALEGKAAQIFGDPEALHTWIYVRDFANGLVTLAENEARGVWHLPCPGPLTQRELLHKIFEAAGHEPKLQAMPGFMLKVLGVFVPIMKELAEMDYQWRMPYEFKSERFQAAFDAEITSHEDAIRETLDWFRANPK